MNYDALAQTAQRLIEKSGQTITLKRSSAQVGPVTGQEIPGSEETLKTVGVVKRYPVRLIDGTRITASDREVVMSAEIAPKITDKVMISGHPWAIQEISEANPAGVTLAYFVRVRR